MERQSKGSARRTTDVPSLKLIGLLAVLGNVETSVFFRLVNPQADGVTSDTFTITAGCDKTFPTCKAKFANQINFRGFPHMPGNKFLMAFPSSGDPGNDGASMNG